jgi:hypothetical protein
MSNDLGNNRFERSVRNKLKDYRTPVDPSIWNAIEKSLIRSKRLKYLYVAASIVAAAAILFMITLNLPDNDNPQNIIPDIEKQTAQDTINPNQQTPKNQTKQEQFASNPIHDSDSVVANDVITNTIIVQAVKQDTYTEDPPVKEKLNIMHRTISGASTNISSLSHLQLPNNMRLTGTLAGTPADKKSDDYMPDKKDMTAYPDKTGLTNKKWSVLMSFGAGNYQASNNIRNKNSDYVMATPLLTSSNSVDYIRNKYKNEIMVPDNAGSQYGLPLSAKLIVRKDINARWAIESGLSYTYLSTKYKWGKNTVNQQLHYLGIPLNVVCYMVSKPNWNIYASAGGMVEKGVYSHIDRNDNLATKVKMRGLQWSVNGTVGATYKLTKRLGLFFEPQVGYFFNNEQPESIRTEFPVSFGLGIGLRFNL